jgi:glycosyltransferase involved in cell wall biosynthesis
MSIGFPFVASRFGGSTVSALLLAEGLKELGHSVFILAHGTGPLIQAAEDARLSVVRLPLHSHETGELKPDRFRVGNLLGFRDCSGTIKRCMLDVVHVNDLAMLRTWILPTAASKARAVMHWRSNYRKSWSVDIGLRLCDLIISIAQYAQCRLPDWAHAKTVVEYNPFGACLDAAAIARARGSVREKLGIPLQSALIGVFGNHAKRKQTNFLADIVNAIPSTVEGKPVFGIACGGRMEPYDDLLDAKIEAYGLGKRLFRPGFVRPVEEWMAACDLILAPARSEPFGRTPFEAAQAGVPILMSSDSGAAEVIVPGQTGVLIAPDHVAPWIEESRNMLNAPARAAEMVQRARSELKRFSPIQHATRIDRLYRGMLCNRSRSVRGLA